MDDTTNIEETLVFLIRHANPEGRNYKRLNKLLRQTRENVFLGPSSRKFIAECLGKFDDIECKYLTARGMCKHPRIRNKCMYTPERRAVVEKAEGRRVRYSSCGMYIKVDVRVNKKENPLSIGGGK